MSGGGVMLECVGDVCTVGEAFKGIMSWNIVGISRKLRAGSGRGGFVGQVWWSCV